MDLGTIACSWRRDVIGPGSSVGVRWITAGPLAVHHSETSIRACARDTYVKCYAGSSVHHCRLSGSLSLLVLSAQLQHSH